MPQNLDCFSLTDCYTGGYFSIRTGRRNNAQHHGAIQRNGKGGMMRGNY
jgi:hypothetical protein